MKTQFKNVVSKEGNYFVAQSLNIDVSSFRETKEEAFKNLKEAIELYLEESE
jgi:predicted RNase H-like HicB family nuclease